MTDLKQTMNTIERNVVRICAAIFWGLGTLCDIQKKTAAKETFRCVDYDKLYTSLSANTIMAKLTNHVLRTRFITSSTDKHYSLDSEDDFHSGCQNVSHQQQFFSELPSPGQSHYGSIIFIFVFFVTSGSCARKK